MATIAPVPNFSERDGTVFERKAAPNVAGQRGPLRFEEGVATDTDVPSDFGEGAFIDTRSVPGRPNHKAKCDIKPAEQTTRERVHVGSASWIDANSMLTEFASGASVGGEVSYDREFNSGARQQRVSPERISD